jgi:hypothetical protein
VDLKRAKRLAAVAEDWPGAAARLDYVQSAEEAIRWRRVRGCAERED